MFNFPFRTMIAFAAIGLVTTVIGVVVGGSALVMWLISHVRFV